jgi:Alginate lyase
MDFPSRGLARILAAALLAAVAPLAGGEPFSGDIKRQVRPTPSRGAEDLLLLDRSQLDRARDLITRSDALATALKALRQDADTALTLKPSSVMDKTVTPLSGDRHDYMSQAPYWWPDPTKPDGLPYIRRDGERNPEINRISDHDNLGRLTTSVATLGLAYYFTGRDQYATHAAKLLRVWFLDPATGMNPHLHFGQGIPGITDGRGIGIIETRGLPDLLDGTLLLTGSAAWTPEDARGLRDWMRQYLTWLIESPHGKDEARNGNNHETWYDVQVGALALYTGQPDLARRLLERSRERVARQIEPDGRQPRELERTRSWDYSIFNLRAFLHLARLGDRVGLNLWHYRSSDGRSLRGALDFLVPYAARKKSWEFPQITPFRPSELHWALRHATVGWNEPAYRALAEQIGGASPRLDLTLARLSGAADLADDMQEYPSHYVH